MCKIVRMCILTAGVQVSFMCPGIELGLLQSMLPHGPHHQEILHIIVVVTP